MNTLTDFLDQAKCQYTIYDLGRLITKISNKEFKKIEHNEQAYPYPINRHACIAITFWQQSAHRDHFIWFLKMPIDEQGLLKIGSQTSFIKIIADAMGKNLDQKGSEKSQERLASNPFIFKPSTEKVAILNAKLNVDFIRPASSFYNDVKEYFAGNLNLEDWELLGFQGFADLCARLQYDNNQENIVKILPKLPKIPLQTLCQCLEDQKDLSLELTQALSSQASIALLENDTVTAILLFRAMANSSFDKELKELFLSQSNSKLITDQNWYISIAGRLWGLLKDPTLLNIYLEQMANNRPELFTPLFVELVAIPSLRDDVLGQIRSEARSPALIQAIGTLFSTIQKGGKS